jgi:signal transduction histidine kinase
MRFGVSAKIFAAYAVLLVAFAATSLFTLYYLHGARRQIEANQALYEVRDSVDATLRNLGQLGRNTRTEGLTLDRAKDNLLAARDRVHAFVRQEPGAYRWEFDKFEAAIQGHLESFAKLEARLGPSLAAARVSRGGEDRTGPGSTAGADGDFRERLDTLKRELELLKAKIGERARDNTNDLSSEDSRAVDAAGLLGGVGFAVAVGAAFLMWRTLRPLQVLRMRARQIASGDYARRIGLRSRDEIGDLAREFDAMAGALEEREQRLIRSERLAAVGRVAAQITHEIRNPLASIGLNAELLGDELPPESDEGRRLISAISSEVDRLSEITETYLRFVRLPKPKLEPEDPGALVTAVLEFARAELARAGVALELRVERALPEIAADESQIRQALLNLVRNAREAMPAGGRLQVGVERDGERLRIAVADTGPGIAPEHRAKIFDPFFSTKEKGTGLGLALVHQIVSDHGGRIEIVDPPGGGTSFVLVLPTLPPPAPPQEITASEAEVPAAPPVRVAVVEEIPGAR